MNSNVPNEILKTTTKCEHDFSCLKDDSYPRCKAVRELLPNFLEAQCVKYECPYCYSFSSTEGFCSCPTRIELDKRYAI
jgi:hypothetical protein